MGRRSSLLGLAARRHAFAGFPFKIEPRDANPGSGTTKNWFNATYSIPAYTYEVGDDSDPLAVRAAAEALAQNLIPSLDLALKGTSGRSK